MPNAVHIWNAAPITEAIRNDMNIGVSANVLDYSQIVYDDGNTHYDDLSSFFNVGNETVRRWYGYQDGAKNRLIPKVAEKYRICEIKRGMIQHSGNRPPLTADLVDNLRLRCFLAAMSGWNTQGNGFGLWRDCLWSGNERELEKEYGTCSEALAAWDDYYMNRNGGKEGAYIYHAWEAVYLSWDFADRVWRLSIHCRDKAFVIDDGSGGGQPGSIAPERYDEIEEYTDDEGNTSYDEEPDDEEDNGEDI